MKQITRILVTASVLLILFQIDGVFAATETKGSVTDAAIEILNLIIGVLNFIITPFIAFAGWLISPDWTMGDIFGFRVVLHDMWITISNITYFIYAIALIIMALASMFNVENYGVKKLLPRFALGIIMVPMTWWFVQATVSLANILTVSVIQIPFETLEKKGGNGNSWLSSPTIPKTLTYDERKVGSGFTASDDKTSLKEILAQPSAGPFSMLNAFAYNIFSIQDIKTISEDEKSNIKAGVNIFNKLLYGLIIYIAFGFVIIALIAALFKRAILLWVYSMFSPLFSLAFFLPDGLKKGLDLFDYKKFIGLAFVPVFVAGALAFGLVLLNLIVNPIMQTDNCGDASYCLKNIMGDEKASLAVKKETDTITSTWDVAGVKIVHIGKINAASKEGVSGAQQLTSSIFGKILFDILGILILWIAVFGALKGSELTAKVVGSVEALGKQAGGMWKYAPLPGIPGGSIHGAEKGIKGAMALPEQRANDRFNKSTFGQSLANSSGSPELAKVAQGLEVNVKKLDSGSRDITGQLSLVGEDLERAIRIGGFNNSMTQKSMQELLQKLGQMDKSGTSFKHDTGIDLGKKVEDYSEVEKQKALAWAATQKNGKSSATTIEELVKNAGKGESKKPSDTAPDKDEKTSRTQPGFDKESQILTINNNTTPINLARVDNESDDKRLERIGRDVSTKYSGELKDLETTLTGLGVDPKEAKAISVKVSAIRAAKK